MSKGIATILLLIVSNVLMLFAWYGQLKFNFKGMFPKLGIFGVILISWMIAFFEYCFMIPANKLGHISNGGPFSLFQLKIIQEAVTLIVFVVFSVLLFKSEPLKLNHLFACIFIMLAVYCVFK